MTIAAEDLLPHLPHLRRYARALTRDRDSADDLVQDTILRCLGRLDQFREGTNLRGWLMAVLHNGFVDGCRRRERRGRTIALIDGQEMPFARAADQDAGLLLAEVERAMARLSPEHRSILYLAAFEDLDYAAMAKLRGLPVGTVRSRLSRARRQLRRLLEKGPEATSPAGLPPPRRGDRADPPNDLAAAAPAA